MFLGCCSCGCMKHYELKPYSYFGDTAWKTQNNVTFSSNFPSGENDTLAADDVYEIEVDIECSNFMFYIDFWDVENLDAITASNEGFSIRAGNYAEINHDVPYADGTDFQFYDDFSLSGAGYSLRSRYVGDSAVRPSAPSKLTPHQFAIWELDGRNGHGYVGTNFNDAQSGAQSYTYSASNPDSGQTYPAPTLGASNSARAICRVKPSPAGGRTVTISIRTTTNGYVKVLRCGLWTGSHHAFTNMSNDNTISIDQLPEHTTFVSEPTTTVSLVGSLDSSFSRIYTSGSDTVTADFNITSNAGVFGDYVWDLKADKKLAHLHHMIKNGYREYIVQDDILGLTEVTGVAKTDAVDDLSNLGISESFWWIADDYPNPIHYLWVEPYYDVSFTYSATPSGGCSITEVGTEFPNTGSVTFKRPVSLAPTEVSAGSVDFPTPLVTGNCSTGWNVDWDRLNYGLIPFDEWMDPFVSYENDGIYDYLEADDGVRASSTVGWYMWPVTNSTLSKISPDYWFDLVKTPNGAPATTPLTKLYTASTGEWTSEVSIEYETFDNNTDVEYDAWTDETSVNATSGWACSWYEDQSEVPADANYHHPWNYPVTWFEPTEQARESTRGIPILKDGSLEIVRFIATDSNTDLITHPAAAPADCQFYYTSITSGDPNGLDNYCGPAWYAQGYAASEYVVNKHRRNILFYNVTSYYYYFCFDRFDNYPDLVTIVKDISTGNYESYTWESAPLWELCSNTRHEKVGRKRVTLERKDVADDDAVLELILRH